MAQHTKADEFDELKASARAILKEDGTASDPTDPLAVLFVNWSDPDKRNAWMETLLARLTPQEKKALRELIDARLPFLARANEETR